MMTHAQTQEMQQVKDRIRALAAKTTGNGCTEAEAISASEKVGQLLDQYQLSLSEIMLNDETCITDYFNLQRKRPGPFNGCPTAIADFCDCVAYKDVSFGSTIYAFFGLESDVQMALYLAGIVKAAMDTETQNFKKNDPEYNSPDCRYPRKTMTINFQRGLIARIVNNLREMKKTRNENVEYERRQFHGTDIVHLKKQKVKDEWNKTGIKLRHTYNYNQSRHHANSFMKGYDAGANVNLSRPVNGGDGPRGYLT